MSASSYLITGSSGFIGRHLCALLQAQGIHFNTVGRHGDNGIAHAQHWQLDLNTEVPSPHLLQQTRVVFHLAGLAHQPAARKLDAEAYFVSNRDATLALAEAASAAGVERFVYVSSVKAARYDSTCEPNDESIAAFPADPYGLSKRQAEEALLQWPSTGMQVVIVRPSLVYGPGVKGNLRSLMRVVRRGWFPVIQGGGVRSMVSVKELCDVIVGLSLAEGVDRARFIVTDNQHYTIERIITAMRCAFGKRGSGLRIRSQDLLRLAGLSDAIQQRLRVKLPIGGLMNKLCASECYSSAHLQKSLAWQPTETLESQLEAMVRYVDADDE